ncbi:MAG: UDP-3-O-(3-hydroxymyristoyl)glucosamine N-acyltransferase [Saprospiraceae bacterium]|nr:UDP-3-O-(3-hydroxymyristoyl)glucosamine N-acyltransferase [Saprospiraceae bacterium]
MQLTAQALADLLDGIVEGNPDVSVNRPSKIEEGEPGSISFLGNLKYEEYAYTTKASILLVSKDFKPRQTVQATLLRVDNVYASIQQLLQHFGQASNRPANIAEQASIHESAELGKEVSIGAFTILQKGVKVGTGCQIHEQVYLGENVQIGEQVILYPGVKIYANAVIGDRVIIHANAVVGSDGFGFVPQEDGHYKKVAHVGNVVIEDDVEIGANTTIDRGTMGSTLIKRGVKLDNLIQIGHNVVIDEDTVIAAQTGVAGSTKIGKGCRIGGQVGFVGHVTIADGTQIQAQSGIAGAIKEPGTALFGSPAIPYRDYIRSYAVFKKLPELYKRFNLLEKKQNSEE